MRSILDLTHLKWSNSHHGSISYGCYYKASETVNGKKVYYKCSNFYAGYEKFGDESVNEVICSRFLSKLGFDSLKYTLVYARVGIQGREYTTYVCKSDDFFRGYDSRITFERLHLLNRNLSMEQLVMKLGIQKDICDMIVADFLTLQRDRHGGNIELLVKDGKYRLSPLFDNGLGLLAPYPSCFNNDIRNFDVLGDYPVNNYIGSRSLYQNLDYIKSPIKVNNLTKRDRRSIFYGLSDVLPKEYLDKIWELLIYRYAFLRKRGIIVDT